MQLGSITGRVVTGIITHKMQDVGFKKLSILDSFTKF